MKTRVKIEFAGDSKARYAYATTEHAASSYGQPVIDMGGEPYGCADLAAIGGTVVTSDRALAERMERLGYAVRVSDPGADWRKKNVRRVSLDLTAHEQEVLEAYCAKHDTSLYTAIKHAIRALGQDGAQ